MNRAEQFYKRGGRVKKRRRTGYQEGGEVEEDKYNIPLDPSEDQDLGAKLPDVPPPPLEQRADAEDIETAPPYQVAGPPMPPPRQAQDDEWERMPPGGFKPAAKPEDDEFERVPSKQAAADEWERAPPGGFKPEESDRRGIIERATTGFKGGYEPILGDAVKKISPEFAEQHPIIAGITQSVLDSTPIGMLDKVIAALTGAVGGAAGVGAGVAEKSGLLNRAEADRLQRDLTIIGQGAMIEPGMGVAATATHGRAMQVGDVGKPGLKELKQQDQLPIAKPNEAGPAEPSTRAVPATEPDIHGKPSAEAAPGTAEPQPKPPDVGGPRDRQGPEDYGKKTPARGAGGGLNVGDVDPTIASALKPLEGEVFAPGEQIPQFPRSPTAAETTQTPPTPSHPRLQEAVARANAARQAAIRPAEAVQEALKSRAIVPEIERGLREPKRAPEDLQGYMDVYNPDAIRAQEGPQPALQPPPAAPETVRLYRLEPTGPDVRPDWIKQEQAASGHAGAEGRWFVQDPKMLDWYRQDAGDAPTRIVSIDVPRSQLEQYRVANADKGVQRYSRDPQNEFFVPRELADRRQPAKPAVARETGRLKVARNPDSTWAVKNPDGTIVSTHPNADQAIRAARAAVPAAPAEVVRGPAPAVEAPSAMPRAGTPVGKIGDFTIMRQPDGTWHAVDPATGRPLTEEPFATRKQAANAAHDEIQRRRETPAEELGAEAEPASAGAAATPAGATTPPKPGFRERMAIRVADLKTQASDAYRAGVDKLFDIGRDLQMKVAPMATGSQEAMALVKDHASWNRRIDHEWSVADNYLERTFKPEARKAMWDRADEENTMRQRGEVSEHMGIAALTPEERAAVESFQPKARELWEQYRQAGMVGEGAEGLPYYTPRMLMNIAEGGEGARTLDQRTSGVRTSAPGLKGRKYLEAEETEAAAKKKFGEEAAIARDIRAMPMALAQGEKALAGRQLINKIKEIGRATGEETVVEGQNPGKGWFHVNHPSFFTWRPRMEVADTPTYRAAAEARSGVAIPETKIPLLDRNGNMVFDKVPIWVRGDFEGPIKSFIHAEPGKAYKAAMELKGKTMAVVMISPMIHNLVEYGRAIPAAPGKVISTRIYFEGNAAKHGRPYTGALRYAYDHLFKGHEIPKTASPTMLEAVDSGMMPIGRRFFNQDITSMMEQPNLTPGRSLTAKILGLVPDLFNPAAGAAVKRAVDRMGDIWHNTLLWDRIGDLQMGLYVHARDTMVKKGVDSTTAKYTAAHIANRYAGALPQEAMSSAAQKIANMTMFSRSFTLGNLGVMKDMFNGMPRDVRAQIARDLGQTDPRAANFARSMARRKAISIVAIDIGLMYVMNSALQSGMNMLLGDKTLNEEGQDYVRRFNDLMKQIKEDPLTVLQPFKMAESLSATYENEPDKQDRIRVSETPEGRAIYGRNPVGKIGEEFTGWMAHPAAKLQSKLSTIVRPIWKILDNDAGFGRKIYDPHPDTIAKYAGVVADIAKYFIAAQTPEGQLSAFKNLLTGEGNQKLNILQAIGPLAGVTFSKGHPGGPAAGELARMTEQHKYEVQKEMPEIQKLIQSGKDENIDRAIEKMDELKIPPGLQRFLLNPHISKRQVRDLYKYGTEEQINRFERARGYAEGGEVDDEGLLDMDPLNPWQDPVQKFDPDLPLGPYEDPRGRELIPDMDPKAPYRTPVYKDPGHRRQDKA